MENKNDTLQNIKDEYATEGGWVDWNNFLYGKILEEDIDEISTRYAAKENEQLRERINKLEKAVKYLEPPNVGFPLFIKKILWPDRYDNPSHQNTDV